MSAVARPPYIVAPLPRCAIVVERHTHKNGGSSIRSVLTNNDMHDGWVYWGYGLHQYPIIVNRLIHMLLGPHNNQSCAVGRAPLRLFAEHHYSRHSLEAILGHFGPYSPLQRVAAQCHCRVVLVTRLREPLSFYVSFYRWTVNWRQQRNASQFGRTMLEWAPINLQSSMLLNPLDATWAEFVGVHSAEARTRRKIYSQFDGPGGPYPGVSGAKRRADLRRVLASFDLVGLVERFDETMLLLTDLTGIQRLLYTRMVPGTTNPNYEQPSREQVCPDMQLCRQRVREVAPIDHEIYAAAAANFEQRVQSLGAPFQRRLAAYRQSLAAYQKLRPAGQKNEHQLRVVERSASSPTEMHYRVPISRLHCRMGDGPVSQETCQRLYADTPFRYNWRHTRDSCCARLSHCVRLRLLQPRSMPLSCHRWLPARVVEMAERGSILQRLTARQRKAERYRRELSINATLPAMCARECGPPSDPEPGVSPAYRVPGNDELAALPAPLIARTRRQQVLLSGVYRGGGNAYDRAMAVAAHPPGAACNDTPAELVAGKPWLDFTSCVAEGDERENLVSTYGPCARTMWMRVNCRRTCGLCGFGLRELVTLKPWQALKAARMAARARGSPLMVRGNDAADRKKRPGG